MNPIRLAVKIPATNASGDLAGAIPVFHRCMQQALLEGLLIDVADYLHVPNGPGVLLVGHDVDYSLNDEGLTTTRKRQGDVSAADQLRDTLRIALGAVRAITDDGTLELDFDLARFDIIVADRLRSANTADGADAVLAELQPVLDEAFGAGATVARANAGDERAPVAFSVVLPAAADLEAVMAKLPAVAKLRIPYAAPQSEWDITAEELKEMRDSGKDVRLIDVREQGEFDTVNLGGDLIPLGTLGEARGELDASSHIVVHCKAGGRGAQAVKDLRKAGFENAWNLRGGILAWIDRIDPSLPRY